MLRTARVALVAILLTSAAARAERPPIVHLAADDGLGHEHMRCAFRDSRQLIWFCTAVGLARFDGRELRRFDHRDGLPSAPVNDLLEAADGGLWAATERGLFTLAPDAGSTSPAGFQPVAIAGRSGSAPAVHALAASGDGLWAGTDAGLMRLEGHGSDARLAPVAGWPELAGPSVRALAFDGRGSLWAGGAFGLVRWSPPGAGQIVPLPAPSGVVQALRLDRSGRLWVGFDHGAVRLDPAALAAESEGQPQVGPRLEPVPELEGQRVRSLFEATDGGFWVGAVGALHHFDGERWRRFTTDNGLPDETVNAMVEDGVGNLWLATDAAGVIGWVRDGLVSYGRADGLGHVSVSGLFEGRNGTLHVVGEVGAFFSRLDGDRFTAVCPRMPSRVASRLRRSRTRALQDSRGEWWIASIEGLLRYPATDRIETLATTSPAAIYRAADGLTADVVHRLLEDTAGDLWIGTAASPAGALTRWRRDEERFEPFGPQEGLPAAGEATAIYQAPSGALWIGWSGGELLRFRDGRFDAVELPSAAAVNALLADRAGRLWVATAGDGVVVGDDPELAAPAWRRLGLADGLGSLDARCLVEDLAGRVYVGTVAGIDRLDPDRGSGPGSGPGSGRHFSTADGLAQMETTVAFRDRHGALWFGTFGGLSRLLPARQPEPPPPPVWIERLTVDDRPWPVAALGARTVPAIELAPGRHRLSVDFFAPSFLPGQDVGYQFRLGTEEGDAWSPLSPRRNVLMADLGAGRHRLEVRAVAGGRASPEPASVSVLVAPPFWRRAWFVALAAVFLGAALLALHRTRLRSALALERVRTRIAADLHDDLGAGLSRISFLAEVARRQRDGGDDETLGQIGSTARGLTGKAREIVWSLDPRYDDLGSLVVRLRETAAELLDAAGIAWTFDAPDDEAARRVRLRPEQRQHLLLIFKEALHNAARHSGARRVEMALALESGSLSGRIVDDGGGIGDLETARLQGHGLSNLSDRAAALGGRLHVGGGPGTHIDLRIPLAGATSGGRLA